MNKGYFGIGIFNPKIEQNIGGIWRTAHVFGASFIFTIGGRYKLENTDTSKAYKSIPLFQYKTFEDFNNSRPKDSSLIGIELDKNAIEISKFAHPARAVYLLGNESQGIPGEIMSKCDGIVKLPGEFSLNVATAASIVMFDRINKTQK